MSEGVTIKKKSHVPTACVLRVAGNFHLQIRGSSKVQGSLRGL